MIALATPKSITFRAGLAVLERDQDVRGLDVAVDDPLLVRALDGLADLDEEPQPGGGIEVSRGQLRYGRYGPEMWQGRWSVWAPTCRRFFRQGWRRG